MISRLGALRQCQRDSADILLIGHRSMIAPGPPDTVSRVTSDQNLAGTWRTRLGTVGVWAGAAAAGPVLARQAEELGLGAIWVGGSNADLAALAGRSAMLAATERIVVATGIASIWAWEPAELAAQVRDIDAAHPERFLLGLGVSHVHLVKRLGRDYTRPLTEMRRFLDGLDEAGITAGTRVLAALGPKMLELARDRSVGAHPYLVTPAHTQIARKALGPEPLLAPEQAVVVSPEPDYARQVARDYLGSYLVMDNYRASLRGLGFGDEDFEAGGSDRLVDAVIPWGDADVVAARVTEHLAAGADHVAIQPLGPDRTFDHVGLGWLAAILQP
jgi:probable F420-dependent oxidoreductase